jgi:hypothetical protein
MVKRYPHAIKIAYNNGSFVDGVWVPGEDTEIETDCRIEPLEAKNDYKAGAAGDIITAEWEIFCPLFEGANNVPDKAKVLSNSLSNPAAFRAKDRVILRFSVYQKHISIKV